MRTAIVADAHIGGPGGEVEPLLEQLAGLPAAGAERLLLLGDLFQAWIGFPQYETAAVGALVGRLGELRAQGLRIDYVEGNRDFFLAEGPYRAAFDFVGAELSFASGGKRYLAVHGDGLNDRDRQYLAWRWLSKSWAVEALIRHLPRVVVGRFVGATERRLSQTNFKHKAVVPEAAIRRYATRRLAAGHDVLLLGHFHEPHVWQVGSGEVRLLDAWFRTRQIEWLGES